MGTLDYSSVHDTRVDIVEDNVVIQIRKHPTWEHLFSTIFMGLFAATLIFGGIFAPYFTGQAFGPFRALATLDVGGRCIAMVIGIAVALVALERIWIHRQPLKFIITKDALECCVPRWFITRRKRALLENVDQVLRQDDSDAEPWLVLSYRDDKLPVFLCGPDHISGILNSALDDFVRTLNLHLATRSEL